MRRVIALLLAGQGCALKCFQDSVGPDHSTIQINKDCPFPYQDVCCQIEYDSYGFTVHEGQAKQCFSTCAASSQGGCDKARHSNRFNAMTGRNWQCHKDGCNIPHLTCGKRREKHTLGEFSVANNQNTCDYSGPSPGKYIDGCIRKCKGYSSLEKAKVSE
jgi:hypothetical protein